MNDIPAIVQRSVARFRRARPGRSVPGFPLMPDRQNRDAIIIDPVHHHVSAVAEIDQPFAKNRIEFVNGTAEPGLSNQNIDASTNRLDRTTRGRRIVVGEKTMKADNRLLGSSRPDQS